MSSISTTNINVQVIIDPKTFAYLDESRACHLIADVDYAIAVVDWLESNKGWFDDNQPLTHKLIRVFSSRPELQKKIQLLYNQSILKRLKEGLNWFYAYPSKDIDEALKHSLLVYNTNE